MRSTLSSPTFRSPRSIPPMYVRCSPERSASSSCEMPWRSLSALTARPKVPRSALVMCSLYATADY